MKQNWKSYLKMLLAAMLPIFYSLFIEKNPSFPLKEAETVELLLWIIASIIGGWEAMKMKVNAKLAKKDLSYEEL